MKQLTQKSATTCITNVWGAMPN